MILPFRLIELFVKSNQENNTDSIFRGFLVPSFAAEVGPDLENRMALIGEM